MSAITYYIICAVLSILVLIGISMMSKVETAVKGNMLSALSLFSGVVLTLVYYDIFNVSFIYICILIGSIIGYLFAKRVKMIQMPQLVALLNGVGGAASAFIGVLSYLRIGSMPSEYENFTSVTAILAVTVGLITLVGSLVAAGKLHKILPQKPIIWKHHQFLTNLFLLGSILPVFFAYFSAGTSTMFFAYPKFVLPLAIISSSLFGLTFAIRVGGADMPITISLLNSLSGIAGAIAGMAIGDILLVSVGGIVGASGLLLTQIMCRNMNRHLMDILLGKTSAAGKPKAVITPTQSAKKEQKEESKDDLATILSEAKSVILIPGYGMALAQAQHQVKQLADKLQSNGANVRFAIHPVAGRMPGHMNVLLAEADVPYDELHEMETINDDFKDTDLAIVIGANDVVNPAAREAEGTPIYGMPVLNADDAKHIIICNFDTKPGYAGVENPLYKSSKTKMLLGDAKESLYQILENIHKPSSTKATNKTQKEEDKLTTLLSNAKDVILVPGYGMALAQAQHQVKQLADKLESNGAKVRYAIHPVAGRMPGHMNVLLAEADVPYDELHEMETINDDFQNSDLAIVIGANDVINPAAREAEGTPIYGMPVLNVDKAHNIIICNFDTKPGYAGVENPLYNNEKAEMLLGDAKESLHKLIDSVKKPNNKSIVQKEKNNLIPILSNAKDVVLVPGYGMALAQAQHQVKQLADKLESNGAKVRYAIHPVAGRMPGHMNVLLAEADVPYDELHEMETINDDFQNSDLAIVIGANDVVNPAAREAEGTPIYGMPVLNVDKAKHIIICNFDTKPGYAGVDNPLYTSNKVHMMLGDAKESLIKLMSKI